jgi:hypothetical protein
VLTSGEHEEHITGKALAAPEVSGAESFVRRQDAPTQARRSRAGALTPDTVDEVEAREAACRQAAVFNAGARARRSRGSSLRATASSRTVKVRPAARRRRPHAPARPRGLVIHPCEICRRRRCRIDHQRQHVTPRHRDEQDQNPVSQPVFLWRSVSPSAPQVVRATAMRSPPAAPVPPA